LIDKYKIAAAAGIPSLANFLYRRRPLVVTYHGLYDGPFQNNDLPKTFIHVKNFTEQLREIKRRYTIIDPEQFKEAIQGRRSLSPNSALITFDDGYESFFRLAVPVLERLGIKPIVFITTRFAENAIPFWYDWVWLFFQTADQNQIAAFLKVFQLASCPKNRDIMVSRILERMKHMTPSERDGILTEIGRIRFPEVFAADPRAFMFYSMQPEQIRTLSKNGFCFGGHTHTHTILTALGYEAAREEIKINRKKLEAITDRPCDMFAYPNGDFGDYASEHEKLLKEEGFVCAFTLTQSRSDCRKGPYTISRINAAPEDTVESLKFRCTGIAPWVCLSHRFLSYLSLARILT